VIKPWNMRRYKHTAPVWWERRRDNQRRKHKKILLISIGLILYGIAILRMPPSDQNTTNQEVHHGIKSTPTPPSICHCPTREPVTMVADEPTEKAGLCLHSEKRNQLVKDADPAKKIPAQPQRR